MGCPDNDKDGVLNDDDKCPNEAGEQKFNGCPDRDKDGLPDNVDKCPNVYGESSDGCPPLKVGITHDNKTGTFLLNGLSNINDVEAYLEIRQRNGKLINQPFTGWSCPTKSEANKLIKLIDEPVYLTVDVVIKDKIGKEILRKKYDNLSLLCTKDKDCGFVDTRKQ